MVYVSYTNAIPLSTVTIDGDLLIKQTWPFNSKGGYKAPYNDDPLLSISNELSAEQVSIEQIMKRNNARNCKKLII
eukprot:gene20402-26474_t